MVEGIRLDPSDRHCRFDRLGHSVLAMSGEEFAQVNRRLPRQSSRICSVLVYYFRLQLGIYLPGLILRSHDHPGS